MLKDLIEEIQKIGAKKLEELGKEHDEEMNRLKATHEGNRTEAIERIEKRAEDAAAQVATRTEMLANTERRKQLLAKKRELMESIFVDALDVLVKSPNYKSYLEKLVEKAKKATSEGEVIPAKGKKEETETAVSSAGYKVGSEGKFRGGFIVRNGKVDYDFTFDSLIKKQLRDELETKVAHILF